VTLVPDAAKLTDARGIVGKLELVEEKFYFKLYEFTGLYSCTPTSHSHRQSHKALSVFSSHRTTDSKTRLINSRNPRRGLYDSGNKELAMVDKGKQQI
jgi:hypothetical protein